MNRSHLKNILWAPKFLFSAIKNIFEMAPSKFAKAILLLPLLCMLLAAEISAQQLRYQISGHSIVSLRQKMPSIKAPALRPYVVPVLSGRHFQTRPATPPRLSVMRQPAGAAPQIYSYHDLGIFCKLEVQLERAARLPVKIRLGEVQYVDWLEGKRAVTWGLEAGY